MRSFTSSRRDSTPRADCREPTSDSTATASWRARARTRAAPPKVASCFDAARTRRSASRTTIPSSSGWRAIEQRIAPDFVHVDRQRIAFDQRAAAFSVGQNLWRERIGSQHDVFIGHRIDGSPDQAFDIGIVFAWFGTFGSTAFYKLGFGAGRGCVFSFRRCRRRDNRSPSGLGFGRGLLGHGCGLPHQVEKDGAHSTAQNRSWVDG